MLEFRKLQLSDIGKVREYSSFSTNRICDNTVGGALMWRDYFSVEYAEYNQTIIFKALVKYRNNITAFSMPLGKDPLGSIAQIIEYCRTASIPVAFCTVTSEDIMILQSVFSDFKLFKEADWSDYIYRTSDLISLSGRKYSGQRNHINNFKKTYENYVFEEISSRNIEEVRIFYERLSAKLDLISDISIEDRCKTIEVLENFENYGLFGGLLRANGSIAAFSVGEILNGVLFVHIEKADLQYRGAYQVVNNEFARHFSTDDLEYINREENVGDEGLRKSKESYHPCEIIDKYVFLAE